MGLSNGGKLYTFTVMRTPVSGYREPYAIGYVDFPEGVRVFGHIEMNESISLRCDMPMKTEIGEIKRDANGQAVIGYRFAPMAPA
jgi:uncharacterized OB-fold protein